MQRRSNRCSVRSLAALASLCVGCAGAPVHAGSPDGRPGRVAQGAILGSLAGAAIGAGIDHHQRARGALVGGLGGLIVGAIFGEQIERHEAWHRAHAAPPHCHDGSDCDAAQTWPDGCPYAAHDPTAEHAFEDDWDEDPDPADAELLLGAPEVLFDPDSATLSRGAEARLRHLAREVREHDAKEILLRGHSDESEQDGFELSEARARAVRELLTREGVSVRRIAWVAFGDAQPVASNQTAEGRQRNRRVEIVLREPEPDPYSWAGS